MSKTVVSVDEYAFKGTDYVTVETSDGWIYRFMRPEEHEPYRFDMKQRPDGSRDGVYETETPESVVRVMKSTYDCAQLHPERRKASDSEWS